MKVCARMKKALAGMAFLPLLFLAAAGAGASLKIRAGDREYLFYPAEIGYSEGEFYLKKEEEVVRGIFLDTAVLPADAEAAFTPFGESPFRYSAERKGRGIDEGDLSRKIRAALNGGEREIECSFIGLSPAVSLAEIKGETRLLSSFSTDYSSSSAARKNNVAAACKAIGGRMLYPGEEFSFNRTVGKRSREKGYLPAKIIVDGKFVDGVGGGVCQVSSTLYNAVLLAGMPVAERHRHTLSVSYVEPSFDAMVSEAADFRFVNGGSRPLYLVAKADGKRVTVCFYGLPDGCEYRRKSVVSRYVDPPQDELLPSDSLPPGESREAVRAKKGLVSEGFLEVYENGRLIARRSLGRDVYAPLRGVRLVGKESGESA